MLDLSYDDLRLIKTYKALQETLFMRLEQNDFRKITVNDLCKQALISRATFYAHFLDKYDFLKYCLINLKPNITGHNFEDIEKLNQLLYNNKTVIKHLFNEAENETLKIVFEFIKSILNIDTENSNAICDSKYIVLSNILVGGIISYIYWQIDNRFPFEVKMINTHLCDIIKTLQEWEDTN